MENLGDILRRRLDTTRSGEQSHDVDVSNGNGDISSGMGDGDDYSERCPICDGRGWFTPNVPTGHPDFGHIVNCQCQQQRLQEEQSERLYRYSNLGYLARFTFDTLEPQGLSEDPESRRLFETAYQTAVEYAERPDGWLVFAGPNGSGKTHLAAAIANHCIGKGQIVFFVHVPDLLDHLRSTFAPSSEISYSDLFEQVRNTPFLILDGVGSQSTTLWAQEKLEQIVNHRFNARLPTVITTSTEIAEMGSYIRARLQTRGLSRVLEVQKSAPAKVSRLGSIEPEMLRRMTFDTFDVRGNNSSAGQRASLEAALQAARNFSADPDGWLTFFGGTGVGKTHLAVAIAAERMKQGHQVFFAFVPELLDYLRYTFTPDSRITYDRVFDEVKNTPLLILDDIGQEHGSPWAHEKLYQLVVHRHNGRLPTIITTMEDFTEHRGPIGSRVQDPSVGQLIRIDASDYRIKDRGGRTAQSRKRDDGR